MESRQASKQEPYSEKEIERFLLEGIKKEGGKAYKWVSPGNAGVPDRIVILPNRAPIFVELKRDIGKLSRNQMVQLKTLEALGQDARVVRGLKGLLDFFKSLNLNKAVAMIERRAMKLMMEELRKCNL